VKLNIASIKKYNTKQNNITIVLSLFLSRVVIKNIYNKTRARRMARASPKMPYCAINSKK
tara:strand:+ start:896 stop:1075 length:180 start_codon:yes stop_codon:yes gene_type:complete